MNTIQLLEEGSIKLKQKLSLKVLGDIKILDFLSKLHISSFPVFLKKITSSKLLIFSKIH